MDQKGFTLIELIVIIVILGILAVTAIPKYVDMKTEAREAACDGVFGAAQGAVSMNFAHGLLNWDKTDAAAHVELDTGTQLLTTLDLSDAVDWEADTAGTDLAICYKPATANTCTGETYVITMTAEDFGDTTAVTDTIPPVKATMSKNW